MYVCIVFGCFLAGQGPHGPKSPKYLPPGPLGKIFVHPCEHRYPETMFPAWSEPIQNVEASPSIQVEQGLTPGWRLLGS